MRRSLRFSTLMVALLSAFIMGIVLLMGEISYELSYRRLSRRLVEDNAAILSEAADNVGRYIDNIENVSSFIDRNSDIRHYLENPHGENAGLERSTFSSFLNYLPQIEPAIISVFIFNAAGRVVYAPSTLQLKSGYDITQDTWYQVLSEDRTSSPHLIGTTVRTMTRNENPWVISVARNILNGRTGEIIGRQLVELDYGVIDQILSDITPGGNGYVFILDKDERIIYHPQLQLVNFGIKTENPEAALAADSAVFLQEDGKLYTVTPIPGTTYTLVGVTYLESMEAESRQMRLLNLLLALIMGLLAFLGSVKLTEFIGRPLRKLEAAANVIAKGDLETPFDGRGTAETETVAASLSLMIERITGLMQQAVRDQEQIRRSEIRALQSQINPHFLYNTLDSIVWMAEEDGSEDIKQITVALAQYFRAVVSSGQDLVTVREELQHAESYLTIQKKRFENLDYSVEAEPEAAGLFLPKLLVQPLIENAIYHGIRSRGGSGCITVRAAIEGSDLILSVADNGRGMRPQELKDVYKQRPAEPGGGGIGLRNVRDRIELYYGSDYGLEIESTFGEGTTVRLRLPGTSGEETA